MAQLLQKTWRRLEPPLEAHFELVTCSSRMCTAKYRVSVGFPFVEEFRSHHTSATRLYFLVNWETIFGKQLLRPAWRAFLHPPNSVHVRRTATCGCQEVTLGDKMIPNLFFF